MTRLTYLLGFGGKKWIVKGKVVKLWPFTAMAICVGLILLYDYFIA